MKPIICSTETPARGDQVVDLDNNKSAVVCRYYDAKGFVLSAAGVLQWLDCILKPIVVFIELMGFSNVFKNINSYN